MKNNQKCFHRIHRSAGLVLAAAVVISLFSGFSVVPESRSELGEARINTVQRLSAAAKIYLSAKQKVDKGPSKDDLAGCSSKLEYPTKGAWLDDYETRYVESSTGNDIYLCYKPGEEKFSTMEDDTEVTVLARTEKYSLVITEDGQIGWCLSNGLCSGGIGYVNDILEYEKPDLGELDGCSSKLQQPKKEQLLELYDIRYVESSNGKGIYLCYKPGEDKFSTLSDATEVAVMAQTEKHSLVVTQCGEIGWCLSNCLVTEHPYLHYDPNDVRPTGRRAQEEKKVTGTWKVTWVGYLYDATEIDESEYSGWKLYLRSGGDGQLYMDSRNKLDFTWDYAYIEDDDITCYETDIDGVYFFYTKNMMKSGCT